MTITIVENEKLRLVPMQYAFSRKMCAIFRNTPQYLLRFFWSITKICRSIAAAIPAIYKLPPLPGKPGGPGGPQGPGTPGDPGSPFSQTILPLDKHF